MKIKISEIIEKYIFQVKWSGEDNVYIARCLEVCTWKSSSGALKGIKEITVVTLLWMQFDGVDLPKPITNITREEVFIEAKRWARNLEDPEIRDAAEATF